MTAVAQSLEATLDRPMPPAMPGFEHINRYWDPQSQAYAAKILPGEYYVTPGDEVIVTILGSCVAACIRNPYTGFGGMNHFLLPEGGEASVPGFDDAANYGCYAMEMLINALLSGGGTRAQLEVKIFGGGKMLSTMTDLGAGNIAFATEYLRKEGMRLVGSDVGGPYSRKVRFFPSTGRVQLRKISSMRNNVVRTREAEYLTRLQTQPRQGGAELF